jgi:hypothetical protein
LSSKLTGTIEIDETYVGGKFRTVQPEVKADAAKTTAESRAAEKDNKLQTDPAHPLTVQGSDSGRAQSEAAGEKANDTK